MVPFRPVFPGAMPGRKAIMLAKFRAVLDRRPSAPWSDTAPVREELFGVERLEQHAESLAVAQTVSPRPPIVVSLQSRLNDNAKVLLAAYRASAVELEGGNGVVPAAEWLLDNYHLVEEQIREIRDDLPPGYYRQLPKLAAGPFAGYPRVFGLAWAFVAHTDSHVDPDALRRFVAAYQRVEPLTIGELWAVAITLRIVLIENLRRLTDQIMAGRQARAEADALANRVLQPGFADFALDRHVVARSSRPLSELFAAQLAKRLRDQDPRTTPALGWLDERLRLQGSSIDEVVQHAQQRQGASNVSVRNVITSMRLISDIDWAEWFESVSLVDKKLRGASGFDQMDFATRNLYRSAIEQLARGSHVSELEVADRALSASAGGPQADSRETGAMPSACDPGYFLIAEGRVALEKSIGFRPPAPLWIARLSAPFGVHGYAVAVLLTTLALLVIAYLWLDAPGAPAGWLLLLAPLAFLPASDAASALVNRGVAQSFGASPLPGLELAAGVPTALRTLVVVPTLLTSEADLLEQIERLEVHYLTGSSGDLAFALLSDGMDADQETVPGDEALLATATAAIAQLNRRYGPALSGSRFLLLHRHRVWNQGEGKWMGWERKRGKLHELNRLLRGATDTSFIALNGQPPQAPADVRYVITLDADTRLPRDAAVRLVGKMAHPLNRPQFSLAEQRVVGGYAILQPRVTASLPIGRDGSLYQRVYSGPGGMDPYAAAVSDVYQDMFGEGSYTGKGIYDVDAFEASLAGRIKENALLSHDLFEGIYARAGLASDVEVVEDFPSRYDVIAKRKHRWTRGDWQLLPWVFGLRSGAHAVPTLGRWKMLDNLRRSLVAPFTLAALGVSWLAPAPWNLHAVLALVAAIAIPAFLPALFSVVPRGRGIRLLSHVTALIEDLRIALLQTTFTFAFLPDQSWRLGDAVARTLIRLFVTHRHLLEWTTAAVAGAQPRLDLMGFYRGMQGGTALGLVMALGAFAWAPASWPVILPFAALWLAAPALAFWASRSPPIARTLAVSSIDARALRLIARRTWRFFETFVTPSENMLPPDNFQEDPRPVIAHRTSPTNIGLYLLSSVAARDFGWAGTMETVERLEATLSTMQRLARFKGHFFNWYGTRDLRVLEPAYVSSVDSGNLAGHLLVVAVACEEWIATPLMHEAEAGIADAIALAREALGTTQVMAADERTGQLDSLFVEIDALLRGGQGLEASTPTLMRLSEKASRLAADLAPIADESGVPNLVFWTERLRVAVAEHERDRLYLADAPRTLRNRLRTIAQTARDMALAMDFAFLLDPDRKLLSIGYSVPDNCLDPSCYDLLASEARLASLFAIAKGDAPTRHWFRLGRTATPLGRGSALVSWSGSMFEYLMPSLVMRAPSGSLLEQTNRLVVARQQSYAHGLGVPWGISESAYNARDLEFTYQYSNFGVPGLGLKRGLSDNLVIAPYATGLATMIDPSGARANFDRLAAMGASGRYGFYEALDFTPARRPDDASVAIVRNFMAHHQGMTIVAIANVLHGGKMRARFHREPIIQASELLLQERMPRNVIVAYPRAEEVKASTRGEPGDAPNVRSLKPPSGGAPVTHLLSNGRYVVMVTTGGTGFSRWRDIAVTRWREDATRDVQGSHIFLRDSQSGDLWSAGAQPFGVAAEQDDVVFSEDRAEFIHRSPSLITTMDLLVSGEDDGEVRRVSLTNSGRRAREIELTSYAELVLATPATDNAHPAFAKMFVETEHRPEFGALIATRRLRSPHEAEVWAAHFAVVEGEMLEPLQYETDRARFLGRNREPGEAAVIREGAPLSNTAGTVLDPVFALRHRVKVPAGRTVRVAFWTLVASSREELLNLVDKHHDRNAFERAKTLAWTQAQVQLRHLDVKAEEAADFQRLAAPIIYADSRFRVPSEVIVRGAGPQSSLWQYSISGDLPIVLLRIDDLEDMAQVRQLLRAHEYWGMKRLAVDLVILNEHASSYVQDLQIAIETAVRSSQSRPRFGDEQGQGAVHVLRTDLMSLEGRGLLQSVARVVLSARRGSIANQLSYLPAFPARPTATRRRRATAPMAAPIELSLEFFNGLGGFDKNGREYVVQLSGEQTTPAPWINVIAGSGFGFQVSADGSGYTWAENSRENQLTQWSNDPVGDPIGEAFYVRDEATGEIWSPTALPIRDGGSYIARHGFGYSRFSHEANGVALDLLHYVPLSDPIKISRLTLTNTSDRVRRLTVTAYVEWVLGTVRGASAPFVATEMDVATGAMFARNAWSAISHGRVAFADLGGLQTAWTADRTEFLGRNGDLSAPAALMGKVPLSGKTGAGLDPCSALQSHVVLQPGQSVEIVATLGQCRTADEARVLIARYRATSLDAVLKTVTDHWDRLLGAVQVKTPDRATDIMLNGWLLYQTIACRIRARSAFYQASGAYGFRDQLQDGMALSFAQPEETRRHLLRAAARQFVEGDVQHWWLPHSGQGVRTRISDDRVWLAYAAATYIAAAGDAAVLDEHVAFLEGPSLRAGEHDAFFQPMPSHESASLFEHCARGLDQCVELTGANGLPLMGTGDWNDGMNRVGEGGKGESVWLGWLFIRTVAMFAPLAEARNPVRTARWRAHAASVREAIERNAWDGAWYRRATYDDGSWLGTSGSDECQIDSIAQSWAVLSGAADAARATQAMASLERHLVRHEEGIALLFTPPFNATPRDPGYIKGYPPGLRENGGQYSHAAMWAILAFARLGDGTKAHELFALLNPINHGTSPGQVATYKVEPYVLAADVYSVAPHAGRGGWTWYTGSAAWMYRAGIEGILGIRKEGAHLTVSPCIPEDWPGFEARVTLAGTPYDIVVGSTQDDDEDVAARLDGVPIKRVDGVFRVPLDGTTHRLVVARHAA